MTPPPPPTSSAATAAVEEEAVVPPPPGASHCNIAARVFAWAEVVPDKLAFQWLDRNLAVEVEYTYLQLAAQVTEAVAFLQKHKVCVHTNTLVHVHTPHYVRIMHHTHTHAHTHTIHSLPGIYAHNVRM